MVCSLTPYTPADWPYLCAIHDDVRRQELSLAGIPGAFLSLQDTYEGEGLFDGEVWVARVLKEVAGFIAFTEHEITWLYVARAHWRKGAGRALVEKAIGRGKCPLTLEVLAENQPAISLYEAMGFQRMKTVEGHLEGNSDWAVTGHVYELKRDGT